MARPGLSPGPSANLSATLAPRVLWAIGSQTALSCEGPAGVSLTQAIVVEAPRGGAGTPGGQELTEQGFPRQAEQTKVVGTQWALSRSPLCRKDTQMQRPEPAGRGAKDKDSFHRPPCQQIHTSHARLSRRKGRRLHPGLAKEEQVSKTGPNPIPVICELCDPENIMEPLGASNPAKNRGENIFKAYVSLKNVFSHGAGQFIGKANSLFPGKKVEPSTSSFPPTLTPPIFGGPGPEAVLNPWGGC